MQISVTNGGTMELIGTGTAYIHFKALSNELSTPRILLCPTDQRRTFAISFGRGFNNSNLSYFLGLDAQENFSQAVLFGDDNLAVGGVPVKRGLLQLSTNTPVSWTATRHENQGNIALADGSVQQFSSWKLSAALSGTGAVTNRLLIP